MVGGGPLTVHHLARALSERGHSVTVLAHEPDVARADDLGYAVIRSTEGGAVLPALVADTEPDAVVAHAYHRAMRPWTESLLDSVPAVPAVLYLHDVEAVDLAIDRHAYVAAVAAVSNFIAGRVRAGGAAAEVIYPVVDARDYRVPTTRRRVLFVNPATEKGLETASALAALEPEIPFAWAMCWALDRGRREYIRSKVQRLPNVELRPAVLEPAALYGDARALIVPSLGPEGYGRVAREALTSAIPVIAAAVGGLPEAVGDGGVLLPADAPPDEWAGALRRLLDNETVYGEHVARAEREAGGGATSAAAVGEQFERVLERAVSTRRARAGRSGTPRAAADGRCRAAR